MLVSGGLLAGLALATLFAQLALLLLAMLAPIFLLAAIHPGVGRVIATRWANLLVYTAFKRVAYSALLSVSLVVNGALIDQGSKLGWGVAMTLSVALSGALFFYRKPFLSIVERVGSAGAATAPALSASQGTSGRIARRAATGAAIVGGATGAVAAVKAGRFTTRKFNQLADGNTLLERPKDASPVRMPTAAGADELVAGRQGRWWGRVQDHQGGRRYRGHSAPLTPQDGQRSRRTRRRDQPLRHPQRCTPWPELNTASRSTVLAVVLAMLPSDAVVGEDPRRRRSRSAGAKPSRRATTKPPGTSKAPTCGRRPGKPSISPPARRTGSGSR